MEYFGIGVRSVTFFPSKGLLGQDDYGNISVQIINEVNTLIRGVTKGYHDVGPGWCTNNMAIMTVGPTFLKCLYLHILRYLGNQNFSVDAHGHNKRISGIVFDI